MAQSYCRSHYTDLASVRNPAENSTVLAVKPSEGECWIGLHRDPWKWSDGDEDTMTYWALDQLQDPKKHCATADFADAGKWTNWFCDSTKPFICHHGTPFWFSTFLQGF